MEPLIPPYVPGLRSLGTRWHLLQSPIRGWVQPSLLMVTIKLTRFGVMTLVVSPKPRFSWERSVRFASLYAPNRNPERNRFFGSLPHFMDLEVPTFLCGDFNAVLDPDLDRRHPPSYQRQAPNLSVESVTALQSLLSYSGTYPGWWTQHPTERCFSWDHGSGNISSRIDMVWAPISLTEHVKDSGYYPSFLTDHRYLQVSSFP